MTDIQGLAENQEYPFYFLRFDIYKSTKLSPEERQILREYMDTLITKEGAIPWSSWEGDARIYAFYSPSDESIAKKVVSKAFEMLGNLPVLSLKNEFGLNYANLKIAIHKGPCQWRALPEDRGRISNEGLDKVSHLEKHKAMAGQIWITAPVYESLPQSHRKMFTKHSYYEKNWIFCSVFSTLKTRNAFNIVPIRWRKWIYLGYALAVFFILNLFAINWSVREIAPQFSRLSRIGESGNQVTHSYEIVRAAGPKTDRDKIIKIDLALKPDVDMNSWYVFMVEKFWPGIDIRKHNALKVSIKSSEKLVFRMKLRDFNDIEQESDSCYRMKANEWREIMVPLVDFGMIDKKKIKLVVLEVQSRLNDVFSGFEKKFNIFISNIQFVTADYPNYEFLSQTKILKVTASSLANNTLASHAVDDNLKTRWESKAEDPQWLKIELASLEEISGIVVKWEWAAAGIYEILVSDDDRKWRSAALIDDGFESEKRTILFDSKVKAKYVKILCKKRRTNWAYSIWEIGLIK